MANQATERPERTVYFNGDYVPESQVRVSFRDRGFKYGDAAFDTSRTFGGRIFRLNTHMERLYRSLRYLRIDPGLGPEEMTAITLAVVERNLPLLGPDEDYWVSQRISRGVDEVEAGGVVRNTGPTVIVECAPLPLNSARARLFREGIKVIIPSVRRTPPEALSPNAKLQNYLNVIVAEQEARERDPEAWALLLDTQGYLAEGASSNLFLVREGVLCTPRTSQVLPGVSRQTVIELAEGLGMPVRYENLTQYDAYTADEMFLTATSLCLCPVRSVNGVRIGTGDLPGPLTQRLTRAFTERIPFDFVAQYLRRLAP